MTDDSWQDDDTEDVVDAEGWIGDARERYRAGGGGRSNQSGKSAQASRIERFEDLTAWQRARELTALIYQLCRTTALGGDRGLREQIQRSAVSAMSNIAEGFERDSNREFHRYLTIAKGSSAEVRSQLYVALDSGYLTQQQFNAAYSLTERVGQLIGALRASVERRIDESS